MLSDKRIEEFIELYKKRFGKEISKEEAYGNGIKLITLIKRIYKPIKKNIRNNK